MDNPCKMPGGCSCIGTGKDGEDRAIENDVFSYIRHAFELPHLADRAKFHFVLMESQERRVVSLGLPRDASAKQDLSDIDDHMKDFVRRTEAHQWKSNMLDLLHASFSRFDLSRVYAWACKLLERHGQPLGTDLSRLEQCLVTEAARNTGRIDGPLYLPQMVSDKKHLYFIDDYLKLNEKWGEEWKNALRALGCDRPINTGETRMPASSLLFFLAECMQFWNEGENANALVSRLKHEAPGIAVLPFRILGQYRAAAVWSYTGDIRSPKNEQLKRAIEEVSGSSDWLPPTVESALLNKTNLVILDALYNRRTGAANSFLDCNRVRRALADLWYARSVEFRRGDTTVRSSSLARREAAPDGPISETVHENVCFGMSPDNEVADYFGFDSVRFRAPLMAVREEVDRAIAEVEKKLRHIATAVERVQQREIEIQKRLNMSVTAHDFSNALKDLQALSADWGDDSEVSDRTRMMMIHRRAQQLTGNAYIMRKRAREDMQTHELLPSVTRAPTMADARFWETFMRSMSVLTAFAQWRLARPPRGHMLELNFSFCFALTASESRYDPPPRAIRIGVGTHGLEDIPDILGEDVPVWPLDGNLRRDQGKLGEHGQIALMLWGPFELLRNAAYESVRLLCERDHIPKRVIHFDMTVTGAERLCHIRTRVENDCFDGVVMPRAPAEIPSLQRIAEAIPRYSFIDASDTPERARYVSELVFGDMGDR